MRIFRKLLLAGGILYLLLAVIAGVLIAEASLRVRRLPIRHREAVAAVVEKEFHACVTESTCWSRARWPR